MYKDIHIHVQHILIVMLFGLEYCCSQKVNRPVTDRLQSKPVLILGLG